jgi:hypothetical protein
MRLECQPLSGNHRTICGTRLRIDAIEPPPMDYEGLDRVRMVNVLHAIVSRTALPPVEVEELSLGDYHYRLHHGAHRFFASVAVGFTHIPARVRP